MGVTWDMDEHEDGLHASLSYDDVASAGPPARPLDFPAPTVFRCERIDILARDHQSGTIHELKNVFVRSGRPPDTAYLVCKKLGKSVYGSIRLCIVLKRIYRSQEPDREDRQYSPFNDSLQAIEWESTDVQAVMKVSDWSRIHAMRGKHLEDPIREIAAMQLLGNYHPHVLGVLEVLQDDNSLYTIMPHLSGGELYERLVDCCPGLADSYAFDESQAQVWFRHLLLALFHLQKKGVVHRDICLENLIVDADDRLVLVDPGMSLRVPYSDPSNLGCVTDVSAGTCRRLMISQGQGGKLMYAPPEVIDKSESVDAFAIDMWGAGVVLFVMLVGLAPFKWAHPSDKRYAKISQGGLKDLIGNLDILLSPEAIDLLQGFFWGDPSRRITLADAMNHPWVQGRKFDDHKSKHLMFTQSSFGHENKKGIGKGISKLHHGRHMVAPHT